MKNRGLGRGLSALMSEPNNSSINSRAHNNENYIQEIKLENIVPNEEQPRQNFNQETLNELAGSIASRGVLQPIIVQKLDSGKYKIIAGERRWQASKIAGKNTIPTIIKDIDSKELLELAIIENIQREDLTPTEEAESYQRLMDNYKYTQKQLCELLGISRSHIANILRLNNATKEIKTYVNNHQLSLGQAKVLLGAKNPNAMAKKVVDQGLTVRQLEQEINGVNSKKAGNRKSDKKAYEEFKLEDYYNKNYDENSEEVNELAENVSKNLGLPVRIRTKKNAGELIIRFENMEQLDDLFAKLSN